MAKTEDRYKAATDYVRRAVGAVEGEKWNTWNVVSGAIDAYAGNVKTKPVRQDLERIEARWLRAASDHERERIARDAELLADRTKENLPGAPQDWKRTNLYEGEQEKSTPQTSYGRELSGQAHSMVASAKNAARSTAQGIDRFLSIDSGGIGKWLLIGGGVFLGLKAIEVLSGGDRRNTVTRPSLGTALARRANESTRNAASGVLEAVSSWVAMLQAENPAYLYGVDVGPIYARVWRRLGAQDSRSVVFFVELSTGVVRRAESWKKPGRSISTLAEMLGSPRNARSSTGQPDRLESLRSWMVKTAPPADTDPRHQAAWLRGYERTAKLAMDALANRGVVAAPADVEAWRKGALRKLQWDATAEGQGAVAFLDALGKHARQRPQIAPSKKAPKRPAQTKRKGARNATDMTVASTIRRQLGAETLMMLGAKDFVGASDSLQFSIVGSPCKVSKIRIVLAPDDTYTVEFWKGRGVGISKLAEHARIYVDQLHGLIDRETGLRTSLRGRR